MIELGSCPHEMTHNHTYFWMVRLMTKVVTKAEEVRLASTSIPVKLQGLGLST